MSGLISKYKVKSDMYNFVIVLTLILFGMLIITIFFFDFLLISFYLLYIAEILSITYLVKNKQNIVKDKDKDLLTKERNLFFLLIILFIVLIYLLSITNLSYSIIFIFVLYLLNLLTQFSIIQRHLTNL